MVMVENMVMVSIGEVVTAIVMIIILVYVRNICLDYINVSLDFLDF